jgi:formylglycine-generating enzyme required for sulfatase activity
MKIFLSYASEDREVAEAIHLALSAQGHDVFFDREDLPSGDEFNIRIRHAIERTDLFVFLVSAQALDAGSYTLNELEIAEKTWKRPAGRLLPVMLRPIGLDQLPAFLKSVTLLEAPGNLPAAVADAVYRIAQSRRRVTFTKVARGFAVAVIAGIGTYVYWSSREAPPERNGKDGAPAALIPAGAFTMGDDEQSPRREIYVSAFYLDRYEVTTSRYAKFLEATASVHPPEYWRELDPATGGDLPVIGVDWHDAQAYCKWAGKRLPTEAEWEKAARGTDGRRYPWGDASPTMDRANFQNASPNAYDGGLAPVGRHAPGRSPFGIHDLAGNAGEWVADWYSEGFARNDVRDPKGPDSGTGRVIRGGGRLDPPERITATKRFFASPESRADDVGFRCASDP